MFVSSLCFILAAFGTGSSTTAPTKPLEGPSAPQQTIRGPGSHPTISKPPVKPTAPINRDLLQQKMKERDQQEAPTSSRLYIFPGAVRIKDNQWVGFDYLYNVGSNIPVDVTIVKPPAASIPISEDAIKQKIVEEFQKADIDTSVQVEGGHPPRAIFSLMILIYPLNEGFIALCDARLLETVGVKRVELAAAEGVLQAITWEHKKLIVAPTENFATLLTQTVESITHTFIERYKFFESFTKKKEGGIVQ